MCTTSIFMTTKERLDSKVFYEQERADLTRRRKWRDSKQAVNDELVADTKTRPQIAVCAHHK